MNQTNHSQGDHNPFPKISQKIKNYQALIMSSHHLESLNREGFVLVPSILTPEQITTLRNASAEVIDVARSGNWPFVRTLPKQFPPWNVEPGANPAAGGIWGVQFLMHPDLPNSKIFISNYFSEPIVSVVKELLECEDEDLVMELFNLLVRPGMLLFPAQIYVITKGQKVC